MLKLRSTTSKSFLCYHRNYSDKKVSEHCVFSDRDGCPWQSSIEVESFCFESQKVIVALVVRNLSDPVQNSTKFGSGHVHPVLRFKGLQLVNDVNR